MKMIGIKVNKKGNILYHEDIPLVCFLLKLFYI